MMVPSGTELEALLIESTTGIATPFPVADKIIPSEF